MTARHDDLPPSPARRRCARLLAALAVLALGAGCAVIDPIFSRRPMSDHFIWHAAGEGARGWVVLLPGASGLLIEADDRHYLEVAGALNASGFDTLVVDYKPAYRAAGVDPGGAPGTKIAWVVEQALAWLQREHPQAAARPGALLGWSLGAEGVLRLVNDPARVERLGLRAAVLYYPTNQDRIRLANRVPLLILSGELDDIARASELRVLVRTRAEDTAEVRLEVFPGARHAFDVASLAEKKTLRSFPLFWDVATLQYQPAAADEARALLLEFLARHLP